MSEPPFTTDDPLEFDVDEGEDEVAEEEDVAVPTLVDEVAKIGFRINDDEPDVVDAIIGLPLGTLFVEEKKGNEEASDPGVIFAGQ